MKRKIFISLDVPGRDRRRLLKAVEKWQALPAKWTKETNLHLTLVFLGFVEENDLGDICERVEKAAARSSVFDVDFDRIELFPSAADPHAIALVGEANEELKNLVNAIEEELGIARTPKRAFRPHITLGRLRQHKWSEQSEKPSIDENFTLNLEASSVVVMASDFDGGEGEYAIIQSCPLK